MAISKAPEATTSQAGPYVEYFHMGPWHIFVGFTTSPFDFEREMARLGIEGEKFVGGAGTNHAAATTHMLEHPKFSHMVCIITLADSHKHSIAQVAALLAHEATHVAQALWRYIGERQPGEEAEAYLVQYVTQCCLNAVLTARKAKRKRKAKP